MAKDENKKTDPAKVENDQNKFKQRHEDKLADFESPEQLRKDGGEIHPQTTVVPNQPNPEDADEYKGTRYDGNGGKGK